MKSPAAFVAFNGIIEGRVPFRSVGVVEDINEEEQSAFVVFERYDVALDLPLHSLIFIDPCKKQSIRH